MKIGRRLFPLVLVSALLSACASGPKYADVMSTQPSLTPTQGRIYFYRPSALGAAVQPDIKLNGQKVGRRSRTASTTSIALPATVW